MNYPNKTTSGIHITGIHANFVLLGIGVLLFFAFRAPMEEAPQSTASNRTIEVTGSADMLVTPDAFELIIGIKEYWKNGYNSSKKNKKIELQTIEDQVIKCITDAGVSPKDITVNSLTKPNYYWHYWYYWGHYRYSLGEKSLSITVHRESTVKEIIKNMKEAGIEQQAIASINMHSKSHSDIQEYRKLVKERAIEAAKEKAGYLLDALGEELGAIVSVEELKAEDHDRHWMGGHPVYHWGSGLWSWRGAYGYHSSPNGGVSNASLSQPGAASAGPGSDAQEKDIAIKPIKLRYEIKALFEIRS